MHARVPSTWRGYCWRWFINGCRGVGRMCKGREMQMAVGGNTTYVTRSALRTDCVIQAQAVGSISFRDFPSAGPARTTRRNADTGSPGLGGTIEPIRSFSAAGQPSHDVSVCPLRANHTENTLILTHDNDHQSKLSSIGSISSSRSHKSHFCVSFVQSIGQDKVQQLTPEMLSLHVSVIFIPPPPC
jgi:hypothetical protein